MAKASKIFGEVNTFSDFKEKIRNSIDYLNNGFFNSNSLELAIQGLNDVPEETEKKTLSFMRYVDRSMDVGGTANGNLYQKIPTIMAGYIYLRYYKEQVKDLTHSELLLLSRYSIVEQPDFYKTAVDYIGKDLLTVITGKHFGYMQQNSFLAYAISQMNKGKDRQHLTTYIKDTPLENLTEEVYEWVKSEIEEAGKNL